MNKYWCDYNILITSSPFFVVALIKKFTIEPFPGFFTFICYCSISFWASDFLAALSFPFFISRHSLEHSICACCPLTLTCVCFTLSNIWRTNRSYQFFQKPFLFLFFSFFSLSKQIFMWNNIIWLREIINLWIWEASTAGTFMSLTFE